MNQMLIACLLFYGIMSTALAAEDKTAGSLKNTLSAGTTLTDGNSKTFQANASLITEGEKPEFGSVRAGIEANYGESTVDDKDEKTVENAHFFANGKKTISPHTFGCLDSSVLYDDIAKIDYRVTIGPGLGIYFFKNDKTSLSVDAGPSYIWERVSMVINNYLALRFSERFTHTISEMAKVWQSVEYLPRVDDFSDYLLNTELGAEAAMTKRVNLRIVLQDKFDNTPGTGLNKHDLALVTGISLSL